MDRKQREFLVWLAHNPHVYEAFEAAALKLYERGWRRYSADALAHVIRFHADLEVVDECSEYKINNNYVSHLARFFLKLHPEVGPFFEVRALAGERVGVAA